MRLSGILAIPAILILMSVSVALANKADEVIQDTGKALKTGGEKVETMVKEGARKTKETTQKGVKKNKKTVKKVDNPARKDD